MVERLKQGGYRITPQRIAILRVLAKSTGHPSAEDIFAELQADFPTMSLATVYKTLAIMKKMGEVLELGFSELGNRYDGCKPFPHPHVICIRCGKIVDPSLLSLDEITRRMVAETGFVITTHRLDFYGLCPECQQKE